MTQHLLRAGLLRTGSLLAGYAADGPRLGRRVARFARATQGRLTSAAFLLTGLGWLYPATLQAAVEAHSQGAPVRQMAGALPDQGSYLLQVVLGLMFVLGLVFAAAWLIRRVGLGTFSPGHQLKVLATLPLGTRERVVVLDVGGQQLLLGITATTINTLHAFDEPVISVADKAPSADFASKIREVMARGGGTPK